MWEPRLVVVQDAGTPNGIDCGIVRAFEEAVCHKLTAKQPGLDQHKAHWINHQCCHQHCNAEYMQTETSTGEFRMVARATRRIQMGEEIFANYNNIGDETNAFSMPNCMCCSCRDKSKNP
jgi:hypothetical protein